MMMMMSTMQSKVVLVYVYANLQLLREDESYHPDESAIETVQENGDGIAGDGKVIFFKSQLLMLC